jgi:hypothetical protein
MHRGAIASRVLETVLILAVTASIVGGIMTQWSGASAALPDQMFSNGSLTIAAGPTGVTMRDMALVQVVSGDLAVANTGDIKGRFALGTTAPRDTANGAGADGGETQRLTVTDVTRARTPRVVYSGTLAELAAVDLGVFAPGDVHNYRFTVAYPAHPASRGAEMQHVAPPSFDWTVVRAG